MGRAYVEELIGLIPRFVLSLLPSHLPTHPLTLQEHQLAVIDCLEDPDDTLKLKTLELLYKMTKVRGPDSPLHPTDQTSTANRFKHLLIRPTMPR